MGEEMTTIPNTHYKHHPIIAKKYYRTVGGYRWMILDWAHNQEEAKNKLPFMEKTMRTTYPKMVMIIEPYQEQGKGPVRYHILVRTQGIHK
jgi:hypothetical protein